MYLDRTGCRDRILYTTRLAVGVELQYNNTSREIVRTVEETMSSVTNQTKARTCYKNGTSGRETTRIEPVSRGTLLLENLDLSEATTHLLLSTRGGYPASERRTDLDDVVRTVGSNVKLRLTRAHNPPKRNTQATPVLP